MKIQLSDHFTFSRLLRFTLPSIAMMIFTSIYSIVDGLFTSNFAGKIPFAAINLIMPLVMLFSGFGFMFGTGGSALVSKYLGEGKTEKAKQTFSFIVYFAFGFGILSSIGFYFAVPPVARLLGAEGEILHYAVLYARTLSIGVTAFMLQSIFQSFMIAAEKPHLGFVLTLAAGCTNIVLDALFIGVFKWGVVGAAIATDASYVVGGIVPLVYFFVKRNGTLSLGKTYFDVKSLVKTVTNGSSELMTNISSSIVGMLYNVQLLKYAGVDGVAAYGVIMYVGFIFVAIFIGYSMGTAPVVSFHYGSGNKKELENIFNKSLQIVALVSLCMFAASEAAAGILASIFTGYDEQLFALTKKAFRLYSFGFLICGVNIYGSSFFTALNNGLVSALLAFVRTLVFQVSCILLFPVLLGANGIWLAFPSSEILTAVLTAVCFIAFRKRYGY